MELEVKEEKKYSFIPYVNYNTSYLISGIGIPNLGNTCYLNSLLQCILSLTSIFEILDKNKDQIHVVKNPFAQLLISFHKAHMQKNHNDIRVIANNIRNYIMSKSNMRNDRIKLNSGQQGDMNEGLMLILDEFEMLPYVLRLFQNRQKIIIECKSCNKISSEKELDGRIFEVQSDLKTEQSPLFKDIDPNYNKTRTLKEFLMKQNSYVDKNYKCSQCGIKGEKFKRTEIVMAPEIIPILFKKYKKKDNTQFPLELTIPNMENNILHLYKLVAQSEHSGNRNGGHYWAVCSRSDGWKNLNDNSVSDSNPGSTFNTYMIFYHRIGERRIVN